LRRVAASVLLLFLVTGAPTPAGAGEGDPEREALPIDARAAGVGGYVALASVTDVEGRAHATLDLAAGGAVVVAFTSPACPLSRKVAPALARLSKSYGVRGARFVLVDVMGADTAEEAGAFANSHGIEAVVVHDPRREVAAAFGARTTTEVFVLDGSRTLAYRGAVDDRYGIGTARETATNEYLARAIEAVLTGTPPEVAATSAPGCVLEPAGAPRGEPVPTWHGSISRIVRRHCASCHRAGGVAPFSLEEPESVEAHAGMAAWTIEQGVMPPWFAARVPAGEPSPWANDRSLPEEDRRALLAWLASDRPRGDPADAPPPARWPGTWSIGEPDVVFELPREVPVKAEGTMPYVNLEVPTGLAEDRWIRAWEVLPTARDVVHHVLVFVAGPGEKPDRRETAGFLAAFVPGNGSAVYGDGLAKRLKAGSTLYFQLHYTPNGTATRDRTRLGLRFAPAPPEQEVRTIGIANTRIEIPAGAPDHVERASLPVPLEAQILALLPHMHFRGKAFRYDLVAPGGERRTLLDVPRYDFNWQLAYRLVEPLGVAAGSRIEVEARFDNSAQNPANPDPTRTVRWGPQSEDEMLIGYLEFVLPGVAPGEDARAAVRAASEPMQKRVFDALDADKDGFVSREECPPALRPLFERLDADGDGRLGRAEAEALAR